MPTPTVNDIARAVGVSTRTVMRALNGKDRISSTTKDKILKVAAEMNYHPNTIARSLVRKMSDLVGIYGHTGILDRVQRYIEPLEDQIFERGFSILFYTSSADPQRETASLRSFIEKRVAGALVAPGPFDTRLGIYQDMIDLGIKLVILDKSIDDLEVPQFTTDPYRSARLATDYLISLGHERIVHLAIPETTFIGRERGRGFRDAMADAGIKVSEANTIPIALDDSAAAETVTSLLDRKDPPTAIVARHDYVAIGAMRAARRMGLSIPEDLSVVGYGDMWLADVLMSPLTTVRHPIEQIARGAVECLLEMIDGNNVDPGVRLLDVELVVRESCAPPRRS